MTTLEAQLRRALGDLEAVGARSALVGGLAVSALTEPRFTRDVDLAVVAASDDVPGRLGMTPPTWSVFAGGP